MPDQPSLVGGPRELPKRLDQLAHCGERPHPEELLPERAGEPLGAAVLPGLPREARRTDPGHLGHSVAGVPIRATDEFY
jgi:hypothetical protein